MSNTDAAELLRALATAMIKHQTGAYLGVDDDGILRDAGGNLAHYRLDRFVPGTNVLNELNYLHGVLPLEKTDYLHLPAVAVSRERTVPLTIFKRSNISYVLYLDAAATPGAERVHTMQFGGNEREGQFVDGYLGAEMRRRVAAGLDSIERNGERREVSVLFADLRGFTTFCDSNSTIEVFPLLNRFLNAMIKPVVEHGGLVDKIIGDAVMAVFGLNEDGNHKAAAIEAGAEMIRQIDAISHGPAIDLAGDASVLGLGVGIASGQVAVGILGNDRRRSFSVIGHRVNLASRLESQARPGELLVDVATWEALDDKSFDFSITDLWLKGLTRPVPAMSCFPAAKTTTQATLAPVE